jgi:hypothetical protein
LGFGAAGTGLESDDRVAGVVLAAEQALEVEVVQRLLDLRQLLLRLERRVGIALSGELEVELRLLELVLLLAPGQQRAVQQRALAQDALRRLAVVPELRCRRLRVELLNPRLALGEVKDTSRTPPSALRGLRCDPSTGSARSSCRRDSSVFRRLRKPLGCALAQLPE